MSIRLAPCLAGCIQRRCPRETIQDARHTCISRLWCGLGDLGFPTWMTGCEVRQVERHLHCHRPDRSVLEDGISLLDHVHWPGDS